MISCLWNELANISSEFDIWLLALLIEFGVKNSSYLLHLCDFVNIKTGLFTVILKHMLDLWVSSVSGGIFSYLYVRISRTGWIWGCFLRRGIHLIDYQFSSVTHTSVELFLVTDA